MRKYVLLASLALLLTGCGAETFETVSDDLIQPVMGSVREMEVKLPDHAASPVVNSIDGGKLYFCDGYTLTVQTMSGGDLNKTVQNICGFDRETLTVIRTKDQENTCYEWVWTSAGEDGDQLGRAMVLEAGNYHYCLTAMAHAEDAASLQPEWDQLFSSFKLA